MKVKINVSFGATIQATEYNPVESKDSMEIELDVADETELLEKYDHYQKIIRTKVIKNTIQGAKEFLNQRADLLKLLQDD